MQRNHHLIKGLIVLIATFIAAHAQAVLPIQAIPLSNGSKAYLIQTNTIPMVDIEISIDAGSRYDPKDQSGLASLTAALLTRGIQWQGGILNEAQQADAIAELGAIISASASGERAIVRARSLSKPDIFDPLLQLLVASVSKPIFDASILMREKQRVSAAIQEGDTKPEVVLQKRFRQEVFGNYPLARSPNIESIAAIKEGDLKRFHQDFYRQDRVIVNIVGNVDPARAKQIAEQIITALPVKGPVIPALPPLERSPIEPESKRLIRIPFQTQQTHIAMGMTAITRDNPDYFPLLVGNYILGGGGFVSRLVGEVRDKRGFAYSVFSYFQPGRDTGTFEAGLQTRNDQADQALNVLQETIARFIEDGPSDAELAAAKANLINGYPLRLDSNRKLLDNLSAITWNQLPLNTLDVWTQQVAAVKKDDVRNAFKRHLDMRRMISVLVGGTP
ncbi:pitrilysin family protein [Polynucleobacter sp. HIN9]|uniref:M16 family metallopeptidase n=1 Tax=Polynucleobacter sp. HIN9 TaxID=3047868 RepID=UPI0025738100|nr:pitrilysin family protein [Polynucleobacter sp. HIN9]BEI41722.1 pitrilysin family protein [Polynucleobacter sp. HIN9]